MNSEEMGKTARVAILAGVLFLLGLLFMVTSCEQRRYEMKEAIVEVTRCQPWM
jgi:hypothetical protein